ncbi:hypothetical protein FMM05_13030 [Flavobacterium zepuense]|uniref:Uncharacterized protein n=1 Tax=Flavobacterium zepuense TaxID=2593302 RepID=A0A552UZE2_9FLAO|nr:hypothetical protein [Flavobacterium zepuense]TRW23579.1 hypothetical protein FMM05_13030 [Flavobacterium zepuense]
MKLILLLPNIALFAISFFNLNDTTSQPNIAVTLLHLFVMLICLTFTGLIVRSMFTIKQVEMNEHTNEVMHQVTA